MAKENCVDHSDYVGGAIAMDNKMCSPIVRLDGMT